MALANLQQNDDFWKSLPTEMFPSLLPRNVLFDLKRMRVVAVFEQWLCHGWPHTACQDASEIAHRFPCLALVRSPSGTDGEATDFLTLEEQKELIGIGMHVAALSAWVLHNVAGSHFVP